jgi:hypothetical protein
MLTKFLVLTLCGLQVVALTAIAQAGGSIAPPVAGLGPSGQPKITGTVSIDVHNPGTTPTAGYATITLSRKTATHATVSAAVKINPTFVLYCGCNEGLTDQRFLYTSSHRARMRDWIEQSELEALFASLGETVTENLHDPIITAITGNHCALGSGAPQPTDYEPSSCTASNITFDLPGWLLMDFVVDFEEPVRR